VRDASYSGRPFVRLEVRNRVSMLHESVTAEVAASSGGRRRWMLVLPADEGGFSLVEFEHAADADTDAYFSPDDVLDRVATHFDDLDALLNALAERGIETDSFDAPWKMDYPL
jgi:hypothetical protein